MQNSVSFRVPDFVGEDGVLYSDIEIVVEINGNIRDAVELVSALESPMTKAYGDGR